METVDFKIDITGNGFDDRWPECKILTNDHEHFNGQIKGNQVIELNVGLDDDSNNKLVIDYYNRDYKKDVVLDRHCYDPIKSTNLVVNSINLDDIELGMIPYYTSYIDVYEPWYLDQDREEFPNPRREDMQISWNSRWTMEFSSPVYIWLLENI